jgi:hypothetical protein
MFLTDDELFELTRHRRRTAQMRALRYMGIEHRQRPDGSLAVLKSHIEKQFDGREQSSRMQKRIEPNYSAL